MKQRIITALILVAALIGVLFFTSEIVFMGLTVIVILLAAWEWANLIKLKTKRGKCGYVVGVLITLLLSTLVHEPWLMLAATLWWLLAFILVFVYLVKQMAWHKICLAIIGIAVLMPCWAGMNILRASPDGAWLLLFLIIVVSALDSGAYFVGTFLGKTTLAPSLSPKKTIEGLLGGIVAALIVCFVFLYFANARWQQHWTVVLGVVLLLAFFSLLGDLFESMMKRMAKVKDSSNILPGHGGILDRIDSYTAAIAPFILILMLLGYLQ